MLYKPYAALGAAVPAGFVVAAAGWLAWAQQGSIAARHWLPAAIVTALAAGAVVASGAARRPARLHLAAAGLLTALAAWTAASVAWSPTPEGARDEALLVLLYVLALVVPAVSLGSALERLAVLALVALACGALAVAAGVRLLDAEPGALFESGRLEFPLSYANANAAFFAVGFWPAVALAARRTAPLLVRAAGLGAGAAILGAWLLTQSKGAGVGLAVSAAVVLGLAPDRLRLLLPAAVAGGLAAAAAIPLTEPFRAEDAATAAEGAGRALLAIAAAGAGAGALLAAADRRVTVPAGLVSGLTRATAALAAALVVAGGALAATRADDLWRSFSTYHGHDPGTPSHLVSLGGSNRYDFWRVALVGARDEPLTGVGGRGFGPLYLVGGRSAETPARSHSLLLDQLAETGVPGLLLLLAGLAAALAPPVRSTLAGLPHGAAALGAGVVFVAHAAVDWTWTFPAVGVLAFVALGSGAAGAGAPLRRPLVRAVGAGAAAAVAALLFVPPWLAARLTDRAAAQPGRAEADLRLARALDPISTAPLFVEAALAATDEQRIAALREAVGRAPESVAARYALGVALLDAGRGDEARAELRTALLLDPGNPLVVEALGRAGV